MSLLRYALPAIAVVHSALAATNSCSTSGTLTIQNQVDATALAACQTFTGDIVVATGTTDAIALDGVQKLDGGLIVQNAPNLTSLGGDSLEQITDFFTLNDVQVLQTLSFPELTKAGDVAWTALPNLLSLSFGQSLQQTDTLLIQNTGLTSLTGINLTSCNNFTLANNGALQQVTIQLQEVTDSIMLEANGNRLVASFPDLTSAGDVSFRNVPQIDLSSLNQISGSLSFIENAGLTNVSVPKLTTIANSLSLNNNTDLKTISFPLLKTVKGAVNVQDNDGLGQINFPSLTSVTGAFDAFGDFSSVELPKIANIQGAFNLQSNKDIDSECSQFKSIQGPSNVIKGKFTCASNQTNPSDSTPTGSGVVTAAASSSGAANHFDMSPVAYTGVIGVLAAIFGIF